MDNIYSEETHYNMSSDDDDSNNDDKEENFVGDLQKQYEKAVLNEAGIPLELFTITEENKNKNKK